MTAFEKYCLNKLGIDVILNKLEEYVILPIVKEKIKKLEPSSNLETLEEELEHVDECLSIISRVERAPLFLSSHYETYLQILRKSGILSGIELYETIRLYQTIHANHTLSEQLQKNQIEANFYQGKVSGLITNSKIEELLMRSVNEDGYILDDASAELKQIRKKLTNIDLQMKQKLQELISKEGSKLSQSSVVIRDDRYCLAVKSEYKNSIKGMIHDVSASNQTCFIEPLVIGQLMNDKSRYLEEEKVEINRIIKKLSAILTTEVETLDMNFQIICEIDEVFAKAMLAKSYDGFKPHLNNQGHLDLKNARHPLLKVKKIIPNNVSFGTEHLGIVITGPNTGGKTVLLKTVGLLSCMVKFGLLIPADSDSDVMIFDKIFCDIGDDQSIESNLSTFSARMKNITEIINCITPTSLVLFDEIGSGTDPIEGSNLAKAILKYLIRNHVSFITTTHYSQLKAFAFDEPRIINASMEFDQNTLSPTYHLLLGISGSSNAFNIAKNLGLKAEIIQDAKKMTVTSDDDVRKLIFKLEKQSKELEEKNKNLQEKQNTLAKEIQEYDNKLAKIEQERAKILKNAQVEADQFVEKRVKEALDILEQAKKLKQSTPKLHEIIDVKHQIDNLSSHHIVNQSKTNSKIERNPLIGDDVYIPSYDQYGQVQKILKDGKFEISIGNMYLKLNRDEFRIVDQTKVISPQKGDTIFSKKSVSLTLDLRGKRYEEAKDALDKYIDDLLVSGIKQANIIHGYGTGVIRELVQSYVKMNKNISSYRYGGENEGGFGVTVITLK